MAAAAMTAQVERSLVQPGLRSVLITRCPTASVAAAGAVPPPPPPFEFPELVGDAPGAAAGGGANVEALYNDSGAGDTFAGPPQGTAAAVGTNVLVGGLYGLFAQLLRPGLRRASRRAGSLAPMVHIGGEAGAFGVAYAVAGVCKEAAARLGSVVMRVPILGGNSVVGSALQIGLAAFVGNKVGELLTGTGEEPAEPIFLANMCVMCCTPYTVGGGQRVAALSCGHACLCAGGEDGDEGCLATYMREKSDCPLCRASPVHVLHELRV